MPSYLAEDTLPDFASSLDELDLDPRDRFGLGAKKEFSNADALNGGQARIISESIDERSTLSTAHESDASGVTPMASNATMNGGSKAASLAIPASPAKAPDTPKKDVALNGATAILPDRSAANGKTQAGAQDTTPFPATTARNGPDDSIPPNSLPWPSEPDNSKTRTDSHIPTSTSLAPTVPGPHRFSSPPAYQQGSAAVPSPSGRLLPPGTQPPVLKQRHTLDATKPSASRTSKDGLDTAHSTGRFSPTAAAGGNRRPSMNLVRRSGRVSNADMPRDEIAPDEDALRWAEVYRQRRASKRRRKEEEDDDRVLVGTKVDESHANWVTAYNMLTGIRVSVSRTNAKLDRELTDADFEAKQKSTFDITGNELVPSAKYDFKFKDYAPWVFRRLRALFRLDPADYLMSLTGKYILSELGSPGKSGSFFYFSRDYKYIIKTIHHSEHKFLRKVLKDYYTHVQNNPNTLLSQFYGLHRVKMPYGKKIHFVVMNNLFPPHRDVHTTFDLKGSTVGRDYREDDLEENPRATLKDLNWLRRQRNLELGLQKKRLFLEQLQKDVGLLKRLQIMDYSLLVGIHDLSRGNEENLRDKTLRVFNPGGDKSEEEPQQQQQQLYRTPSKLETARKARELRQIIRQERPIPIGEVIDRMPSELGESHSRPGFVFNQDDGGFRATHENNAPADEIYYLGVIDCLTHYGVIKKLEHFWKGLSHDRTQISALPPDQYGDRFYHFVEGITMSHEESQREALRRERETVESARQSSDKAAKQKDKHKAHGFPPMPTYQPPAPPGGSSQESRDTVQVAREQAEKLSSDSVEAAPDRVLSTIPTDSRTGHHDSVLPVVREAGETSRENSASAPAPPPHDYTTNDSPSKPRLSRDSLDKDLPALPKEDSRQDIGVRMLA